MKDKLVFEKLINAVLEDAEIAKELKRYDKISQNRKREIIADLISERNKKKIKLNSDKKNKSAVISPQTVGRMLKSDFLVDEEIIEERKLKSLNKLAIFLGYSNWIKFKEELIIKIPISTIEIENKKELSQNILINKFDKSNLDGLKELAFSIQSIYAQYVRLYRIINSELINLKDLEQRRTIFEEVCKVEGEFDALVYKFPLLFAKNRDREILLEVLIANFRQSIQLWRENVEKGMRLPFYYSSEPNYMKFKNSYAKIVTLIENEMRGGNNNFNEILNNVENIAIAAFDNKHKHGSLSSLRCFQPKKDYLSKDKEGIVLMLQSRLTVLEKDKFLGLISEQDYNVQFNQIMMFMNGVSEMSLPFASDISNSF